MKVTARTVESWVHDFETDLFIADSKRGRHSKTESPIMDNLEFREEFKQHVRQTSREQGITSAVLNLVDTTNYLYFFELLITNI